MNFYNRVLLCILTLLIINHNTYILGAEEKPHDSSFINSFEEDITGDGIHEYIKMQGRLLRSNSAFYQEVWLDIKSSFEKKWSISLQSGYNPKLEIIDLTNDKAFDLFYSVAKEESEEQFHYQVYSLKNGNVQPIPLPKHKYLHGKFKDNFKVNLYINPAEKPITIDISDRRNEYVNHHIYGEEGKLNKQQSVHIGSISKLTTILISKSKGYGLKSVQPIFGIDEHKLGTVEIIWYFDKNKWINLKADFVPTEPES